MSQYKSETSWARIGQHCVSRSLTGQVNKPGHSHCYTYLSQSLYPTVENMKLMLKALNLDSDDIWNQLLLTLLTKSKSSVNLTVSLLISESAMFLRGAGSSACIQDLIIVLISWSDHPHPLRQRWLMVATNPLMSMISNGTSCSYVLKARQTDWAWA